jgi:molybdopterin converting factor small subunit
MITVTVQLHAHLKEHAESPDGIILLHVSDAATIRDVPALLSMGPREVGLFALNGVLVNDNATGSTVLHDRDRLDIYSLMAGG